jgi:hypothetical protein
MTAFILPLIQNVDTQLHREKTVVTGMPAFAFVKIPSAWLFSPTIPGNWFSKRSPAGVEAVLRSGLHIEFQPAVNTRKMDDLRFLEAPEWQFRYRLIILDGVPVVGNINLALLSKVSKLRGV